MRPLSLTSVETAVRPGAEDEPHALLEQATAGMSALSTRFRALRELRRRWGWVKIIGLSAYELLILFLLTVSLGHQGGSWRVGSINVVTIVLALLLFLPVVLPNVSALSLPFFTGQASIEFKTLHERIETQEEKVALLSNETDLVLNSLAAIVLAPESIEERDTLIIGCQRGPEQKVLGALLKRILQADLDLARDKIVVNYDYGGAALNYVSLYRAKIDLCPSYTWQGYEMCLGPSLQYSAEELGKKSAIAAISDLNKRYAGAKLEWLTYLNFASNWQVVMLEEKATRLGVRKLDDLPRVSQRLTLGCPREFFARDAGFGSLQRAGNTFRKVQFVEGEGAYDELVDEKIDIGIGFSTDPRIESQDLRVIEEEQAFGEYYAVPIARQSVRALPEISDAVKRLASALNGDEVRELVRKAVGEGGRIELIEVMAERFLQQRDLI
jgi:glycine betaine/choline ABC-type transport system substrate-binding protein